MSDPITPTTASDIKRYPLGPPGLDVHVTAPYKHPVTQSRTTDPITTAQGRKLADRILDEFSLSEVQDTLRSLADQLDAANAELAALREQVRHMEPMLEDVEDIDGGDVLLPLSAWSAINNLLDAILSPPAPDQRSATEQKS